MRYSVLTIHPKIFEGFLHEGLLGKAIASGRISLDIVNIRDFSEPPHHRVDEKPYGGGPGMVMKPEPIVEAMRSLSVDPQKSRRIVLSAKGERLTQQTVERLSRVEHLILICGRYEGIDERVKEFYADEEIRVGDYVLMGGEVAAEVIIEATARLHPGVIGNPRSLDQESFQLPQSTEYPQYTRPPVYEGKAVPQVLQDGDHQKIAEWRRMRVQSS